MSFLRNVLHDLVEKRLWPVAVALIVALVAVPTVLAGGSDDASEPASEVAATPSPAVPAPSGQVVSLDTAAPDGKVSRAGKLRNPFKQQHVPKPVDLTGGSVVDAVRDIANGGGTPSNGGGTPSGGGLPAPAPAPAPGDKPDEKPDPKDLYRVTLGFGEVGALKTHKNVARLTPLPSSNDPFVVFLGIKADGRTAVFLVSSDAVPSGDGKCRPSEQACETLELREGDTELLDLQSGAAGIVQYQLELRSIEKVQASQARAAKAHARESRAGREWLRLTVASDPTLLDGWDYSKRLGVLVARTDAEQAGDIANLPPGLAEAAAGTPTP